VPNATRLEWIGKYAAILSALVAMAVGIGQYRRGVSQSMRELEWKQADMARTMVNAMMKDEGWQAMTMLDWEEGRTYEIAPGTVVRILPTEVPIAIEASLRKNGRKRTETQRFITDEERNDHDPSTEGEEFGVRRHQPSHWDGTPMKAVRLGTRQSEIEVVS